MAVGTILTALWAMLPAYVPNNAAVLAGGGRPIDSGREWGDRRLLGDGKTWRGTAVGTLVGVALAAGLNVAGGALACATGLVLLWFPPAAALGSVARAVGGDVVDPSLTRRARPAGGGAVPGVDQLDFVGGALVSVFVVAPGWTRATFTPGVLVVVLVATPILHVGTNVIAYLIGAKNEPW